MRVNRFHVWSLTVNKSAVVFQFFGRLRFEAMKREDLLDLNEALQHPGKHVVVDISTELPLEGDIDLASPLEGFIDAVSTGNLLLITGDFTCMATLECARCSEPIEISVNFQLDEQFPVEGVPSSYSSTDFARVAPDEPYEMFDGNMLMVEVLLRQALILSFPTQPLCSFGWDGPCPIAAATGMNEVIRRKEIKDDLESGPTISLQEQL